MRPLLALASLVAVGAVALAQGNPPPILNYVSLDGGGSQAVGPLYGSETCAVLNLGGLTPGVDGGSFALTLGQVDPLNPNVPVGPVQSAGPFTSPTDAGVAVCYNTLDAGTSACVVSWSVGGFDPVWTGVTLSVVSGEAAIPGPAGPTGPMGATGATGPDTVGGCVTYPNSARICDSPGDLSLIGQTGLTEATFSSSGGWVDGGLSVGSLSAGSIDAGSALIAGCMSLGGGGIGLCNGASVDGSAGGNIVLQPVDGGSVMAPGVTFPNGASVSGDTGPGDLILAAVDGGIAGIVGSAASGPAVSLSSAGTMSSGHIVDMSNNGTTVATIDYAGTIGQNGNSVKLWAGSGLPWNFTNNTSPATGDLFGWYDGATEVASLSPVGDLHASSSLSSAGEIYAGTYADLDGGAFVGEHPGYLRTVHAFSVVLPSVSVAAQSATATAEITSSTVSCGSSCGTTPCLCDASATCGTCVATVTAASLASLQAQAAAIKQGDTCSLSDGNWTYGPLIPYSLGGGVGVDIWNITSGAQTFLITNEVIECNGH